MAGAALELRANVKGADAVGRRLAEILRGVDDLTPLMDEIGAILVSSTQDRFERGRGPDGAAWLPSQRVLSEGGQTLVDPGILLASITPVPGNDQVEVGSNMVYAGIHQFGGEAGRRGATKLPARPYLGIGFGDAAEIEAAAADYLKGLAQ